MLTASVSRIVLAAMTAGMLLFPVAVPPLCYCAARAAGSEDEEYMLGESVAAQHEKDKRQLKKTIDELQDVKSKINDAAVSAEQMQTQLAAQQQVKELEITARECSYEFAPDISVECLGYNGQVPGPALHISEGDPIRLILHNRLTVPTSLYVQGISLPQSVDGLPRAGAGLVAPGQTYTYQFIAPRAGTYWYHPQIIHGDQQDRGLFGALIVDSKDAPANPTDLDQTMVISKWIGSTAPAPTSRWLKEHAVRRTAANLTAARAEHPAALRLRALSQKDAPFPSNASTYFLVNGKCAPLIPALEVNSGSRVRLHIINTTCDTIPLTLTGHLLQVFTDPLNPPPTDVAIIAPGSVSTVEFACDNPGVWSLGSTIPAQNETHGNFPGGIARAVRYSGSAP